MKTQKQELLETLIRCAWSNHRLCLEAKREKGIFNERQSEYHDGRKRAFLYSARLVKDGLS